MEGIHDEDLLTQYLELDPGQNGHSFRQQTILYDGKFELKFDYAPRSSYPVSESSFYVYFNGLEILKVRPDLQGVTTVVVTVNGRAGPNVLEFVENGKMKNYGAAVDNVGIYEWKSNKLCKVREI